MPTGIVVLPLLLACLCPLSSADFTPHFRAFLHDHYGVSLVQQLERTDLGLDASFGGRNGDQDNGSWNGTAAGGPRRAVIFVHGIGNKITRFSGAVEHFLRNGYAPSQLYGTTWGDAGRTPLALVDLKCSYVQQIRSMIVAVRQYTGAAVSVVAYSMGSPLARKAILGGNCVDTRQILGLFYRRIG